MLGYFVSFSVRMSRACLVKARTVTLQIVGILSGDISSFLPAQNKTNEDTSPDISESEDIIEEYILSTVTFHMVALLTGEHFIAAF